MKLLPRAKRLLAKSNYLDVITKFLIVKYSQFMFSLKHSKAKVDKDTFVFECFQGKNASDSPWSIYLELLKVPSDYNFIWVLDKNNNKLESLLLSNHNTKVVYYGTEEYDQAYANAGYWITNCRLPFRLKKKKGQKYIQCWHGTPLKKLGFDIEHGTYSTTSKMGMRYSYQVDSDRYDYFISPSSYASKCFSSAFGIPKEKIIEVGYPRNDALITFSEDIHRISNIKQNLGIDLSKKVVLYAPTWRDMQFSTVSQSYYFNNPLENSDFTDGFDENCVFLFRGHYFSESHKEHSHFIDVSNYNDVNDLYLISDILITDYSSVYFDYALLNRPIVFFMYDRAHYENENRGFYIDVDSHMPGPIYDRLDALRLGIKKAPIQVCHQKFNQKFNTYEDGGSAKRVIDIFMADE
ncbi:CDP-glycerol glycerophosphotransferase family protein [Photobacterium sp. DNB23_23_1]